MAPDRLITPRGPEVVVTATATADHADLLSAFRAVVAANEGYPHAPDLALTEPAFLAYWVEPATISRVARRVDDGSFVGAYTLKPNGVGRAAHVANAGYFVVPSARGVGLGEALVDQSMRDARAAGFDAMQFNFVFETNPARRLYERMGFEIVGRVPEVIDGEAVYVYWRRL